MRQTTFGDCVLIDDLHQLACGARYIRIEPKTVELFRCLAEQAPGVVTREQILDRVWSGVNVSWDAFYRGVCKLRKGLVAIGSARVQLETIPKLGYRLVCVPPTHTRSR